MALRPLLELYVALPAAEFSPAKLDAVRRRMIAKGHVRAKVNHHVQRIRRMFRWGVEKELVPAVVLHGLAALAGLRAGRSDAKEAPPVKPVEGTAVDAVLPHLSSVVRAMVQVQRLCGMRPGEVCRMTAGEIDRGADVWLYQPVRHKGAWRGKPRVVAIGPKAQDILKQIATGLAFPRFFPNVALAA